MNNVSIDEVYEIAAEVAQETITKFLKNLVKLIPDPSEITSDIREAQYAAYKESKKKNPSKRDWSVDELIEDDDTKDYMRRIYEEGQTRNKELDEEEFDRIAGKTGKNISEIFPDDMESDIQLQDDGFELND